MLWTESIILSVLLSTQTAEAHCPAWTLSLRMAGLMLILLVKTVQGVEGKYIPLLFLFWTSKLLVQSHLFLASGASSLPESHLFLAPRSLCHSDVCSSIHLKCRKAQQSLSSEQQISRWTHYCQLENLKADSGVASFLLLVVGTNWMKSSWIAFPSLTGLLEGTAGTTDPQADKTKKFYEPR